MHGPSSQRSEISSRFPPRRRTAVLPPIAAATVEQRAGARPRGRTLAGLSRPRTSACPAGRPTARSSGRGGAQGELLKSHGCEPAVTWRTRRSRRRLSARTDGRRRTTCGSTSSGSRRTTRRRGRTASSMRRRTHRHPQTTRGTPPRQHRRFRRPAARRAQPAGRLQSPAARHQRFSRQWLAASQPAPHRRPPPTADAIRQPPPPRPHHATNPPTLTHQVPVQVRREPVHGRAWPRLGLRRSQVA